MATVRFGITNSPRCWSSTVSVSIMIHVYGYWKEEEEELCDRVRSNCNLWLGSYDGSIKPIVVIGM